MFTKSTKILVAALALAVTSLAFVANASAGPNQYGGGPRGGESYMQDRGNATNTNGF